MGPIDFAWWQRTAQLSAGVLVALGWLIFLVTRARPKAARFRLKLPTRLNSRIVAAVALIFIVSTALSSSAMVLRDGKELSDAQILMASLLSHTIFLLFFWSLILAGWFSPWEVGLHSHRWRVTALEVGRQFFAWVPFALLLNFLVHQFISQPPENHNRIEPVLLDRGNPLGQMVAIFLAVVTAPIVEEILFRGVLQTWLTKKIGGPAALLLSSVVFASVHQTWPDSIALVAIGLMLGSIYQHTRSLAGPIICHALFNYSQVVLALSIGGGAGN